MSELPSSWEPVTIAAIAESIQYGHTASAVERESGPRFLRITDIQDGQVDWATVPSCNLSEDELPKYQLKSGDLVFARTGATTGKSFLIRHCPDAVFASYLIRVRVSREMEERFLALFFQSPDYWRQIEGGKRGVGQPNVNGTILGQVQFSLPPLAEQRRIVAKVEELFSELDEGVANLKKARAQLAVYRQALLKHAFEGHLTADWRTQHAPELESAEQLLARIRAEREERYQKQLKEWERAMEKWLLKKMGPKPDAPLEPKPVTPIAQLADPPRGWLQVSVGDILIGKPTNGRSVTDRAGGFKVLRLTSLKDGTIDLSANKEGDWDESQAGPYILKIGDFLISRGNGSLRLVGRGGVVKDNLPVAYPDTMVRLVVDPLAFDFRLFCLLWNSEVFRQQIESSARTTAGIYKINQAIISNFTFPLMPLPEQAVLLELLEAQLPHISRLEADIDLNLQKAEALRQSILKKAFAGELVPQDPADEPAAALLARIRAEREAATPTPKKSRKSP